MCAKKKSLALARQEKKIDHMQMVVGFFEVSGKVFE